MASTADIIDLQAYRARRQQRAAEMPMAPGFAPQAGGAPWAWWIWPAFVWVAFPVGAVAALREQG